MNQFSPLGDRAWIAPLPAGTDVRRLFAQLRAVLRVQDVVITEERVAIYGALGPDDLAAVESALRGEGGGGAATTCTTHVIRVRYDGEDLAEVASAANLSEAAVIALHTAPSYEVRMLGFLPGFAYLGSLAPQLRLPRRAAPRVRVPAGAVGIAAYYTGIYPFAAAGGWNLLGHTVDFVAWDPLRGATLALGDRVRFEAAP
jgi:UPF0271 protein